ncbi:transmembrane transport protein [Streptomyces sp. F-3]|nr:transmembrane transport protein [Streptomyces sp. F-3]
MVLVFTAGAILVIDMFEGVPIGLGLAVVKAAWETTRVHINVDDSGEGTCGPPSAGARPFCVCRASSTPLEQLPADRQVELDLAGLLHPDHARMSSPQHRVGRYNAHTVRAKTVRPGMGPGPWAGSRPCRGLPLSYGLPRVNGHGRSPVPLVVMPGHARSPRRTETSRRRRGTCDSIPSSHSSRSPGAPAGPCSPPAGHAAPCSPQLWSWCPWPRRATAVRTTPR